MGSDGRVRRRKRRSREENKKRTLHWNEQRLLSDVENTGKRIEERHMIL